MNVSGGKAEGSTGGVAQKCLLFLHFWRVTSRREWPYNDVAACRQALFSLFFSAG
jgi:hypothetical protein